MTISEQLHSSKTHRTGSDPNCPVCRKQQPALTKEQKREVESLIEDSGYSRADAMKIVRAGGI